jgi:hypothetical protein
MLRIAQGIDGLGQPLFQAAQQSDTINDYVMASQTAQYATVPTGANFVKIGRTAGADVLVLLGATSGMTWPASSITNGSGYEANPIFLSLMGATSIGIIASAACIISLAYYS